MLTQAQKDILAADIQVNRASIADGDTAGAAIFYNTEASPEYWVWKNVLSEHDIVSNTSVDGTVWDWTAYIGRSQGERDAWVRMFNGTFTIDPSIAQVRKGIADIFSGGTGAGQRTHLLAIGRRKATRIEKLFATGLGTTASPSVMGFVGSIFPSDFNGIV
jgi:hypothetical protein